MSEDTLLFKVAPILATALGTAVVLFVLGLAGMVIREAVSPSPPAPRPACCCPCNPH